MSIPVERPSCSPSYPSELRHFPHPLFSFSLSLFLLDFGVRRREGKEGHTSASVAISRVLSFVNEHNSLPMQFPETGTNERREVKTGSKSSFIFSDMCDSQKLSLPRDLFREISPRKSVALKGYPAKAMINLDE